MVNIGQAVVGIIVLLVVVGGLLYIFYSRTNAVEKAGSGTLIMLAVVALMIPIFWIAEGGNEAVAQNQLWSTGVQRGMQLYAADCTTSCYGIKNNKVVNPTYLGYSIDYLNGLSDDDLNRYISAGIYNPKAAVQPASQNAIPRSDQYGGALLSNDVTYLLDFIRSASPTYLKTNGYPTQNGFNMLPTYLQTNFAALYQSAVSLGSFGQFGQPVDMTSSKSVTITIVNPGTAGASCGSQVACYTPINVKVKVGTQITWINKSSVGHTITAITGQDTTKPAPQIFDSAKGVATNLVATNAKFTYTVTQAAYTFDTTNHAIGYFCRIHPDMVAQLVIVP